MEDGCELSIVMPSYREADSLRMLLPVLVPAVAALFANPKIIVCDSAEPLDDTAAVCALHGVVCLPRTGGNSYGDAVRSGIGASRGKYVIVMDADGSHNPQELARLWAGRNSTDIVIGSRYVPGGNTDNPWVLILMSRVLNLTYRIFFRLPVYDVSNSFRLYAGAQLRSLNLKSDNFDIVEEILIRLLYGPCKSTVAEVPVTFERRKAGRSKRNLIAFVFSYLSSMRKLQQFRAEELRRERGRS